MALTPVDEIHALQIQAGTLGRKTGHAFEDAMTKSINAAPYPMPVERLSGKHVFQDDPGRLLLAYIASRYKQTSIQSTVALSTGALATSEQGKNWLSINGANIHRCKSDLIVTMTFANKKEVTVGVSTKQCNNKNPTNAQLYFTTARGFAKLLRENGISVSDAAITGLRKFCDDNGFRPLDTVSAMKGRKVDPRRYFWEEIGDAARQEWEQLFSVQQSEITRLLLQKAYIEDRFVPDFLIHKTKKASSWKCTEVAIYGIEELIELSRRYSGFTTKPYSVRKGSYKDPVGVVHQAPRFGIVQMQRGGQAQHPDQLQFNLEASYFYKIENISR